LPDVCTDLSDQQARDLVQVLAGEGLENNDIVQAIDELGLEVRADLRCVEESHGIV
jgi:hypothetical protein